MVLLVCSSGSLALPEILFFIGSDIAYAESLVIMHTRVRRLQNRLIHLFPIQLLLLPSVVVLQLKIVIVGS
jgi:hypothetical protein